MVNYELINTMLLGSLPGWTHGRGLGLDFLLFRYLFLVLSVSSLGAVFGCVPPGSKHVCGPFFVYQFHVFILVRDCLQPFLAQA